MEFGKALLLSGCLLLSACANQKTAGWGLGFTHQGMLQAQVVKMQIVTDRNEFISVLSAADIRQDGARKVNVFNDAPTAITFCWKSGQSERQYESVITLPPDAVQQVHALQSWMAKSRPLILVQLVPGGYAKAWLTNGRIDPDARLIYQGQAQEGENLSFCSESSS